LSKRHHQPIPSNLPIRFGDASLHFLVDPEKAGARLKEKIHRATSTGGKSLERKRQEIGFGAEDVRELILAAKRKGETGSAALLYSMYFQIVALGSVVDCLTRRERVEVKDKKTGRKALGWTRASNAELLTEVHDLLIDLLESNSGLLTQNSWLLSMIHDIGLAQGAFPPQLDDNEMPVMDANGKPRDKYAPLWDQPKEGAAGTKPTGIREVDEETGVTDDESDELRKHVREERDEIIAEET
jgi:hypothetical protein